MPRRYSIPLHQLPPRPPLASPGSSSSTPNKYFSSWRGRQLRTPGPLPWPCDVLENEWIEAQHYLLRLLLGYPYMGPVREVLVKAGKSARVLDVATGVGVWCLDVAEMFPWAQVIGCDNAPIQERDAWENVHWDIVDLDDLPYDPASFDVVHIRFAQLRVRSYTSLLRSAFRLVRPGGVLLIFDAASPPMLRDGTSSTGTQAWTDAFHKSLRVVGLKSFNVEDVVKTFKNEDLDGSNLRVPIGHGEGRMGQLGKIHEVNTQAYLEVGRYVLTEYGAYTDAEVDVLTEAYLKDVRQNRLYTKYHSFVVRKGD